MTDEDKIDALREALRQIAQWSEAYPVAAFPEPDFGKARELLEAGGMTLDRVAGSAIRRALDGVGRIAKAALEVTE